MAKWYVELRRAEQWTCAGTVVVEATTPAEARVQALAAAVTAWVDDQQWESSFDRGLTDWAVDGEPRAASPAIPLSSAAADESA